MNVLVIQTAFLGDAILTLPLIREIKKNFTSANIDVLAIPSTAEIFKASPFVSNVFTLDKKGKQKSLLQTLKFALELKENGYEKIFSPHRSFRTSLIVKVLNAPVRVGFDNSSWKWVYTQRVEYRNDYHEVQRNLSLLGKDYSLDESWKIRPEVEIKEETEKKVENFLAPFSSEKIVALACGSVWETKKYPLKYFIEIALFLLKKNFYVLLIGGGNDRTLCEQVAEISKDKIINSAGKFTPVESIALLKRCEFIITNDSAPTHMAQAAGIKTLTLYTSTVPQFGFYPYLPGGDYLSYDNLDCKPCGIHGRKECPVKTFDCGYLLKPEVVIEKLEKDFIEPF